MASVEIVCAQCGSVSEKEASHVNRSNRIGSPLYCGRECAGIARRKNKTQAQKRADKAEYDRLYREKNREAIRAKKAEYFQRTYDPAEAAIARKRRMPAHVEYCRRPEYRAWKREYDRKYRAKKEYGDYAPAFLAMMDLRAECLSRADDYSIRLDAGTLSKTQKRKRDYARTQRHQPETGPLGDAGIGSVRGNRTG